LKDTRDCVLRVCLFCEYERGFVCARGFGMVSLSV